MKFLKKIILAKRIRKLRTELRYFGIDCTTITDEQMIEGIINLGRELSKFGVTTDQAEKAIRISIK